MATGDIVDLVDLRNPSEFEDPPDISERPKIVSREELGYLMSCIGSWNHLGAVVSSQYPLYQHMNPYFKIKSHFEYDGILTGVYPLKHDVTYDDIWNRMEVYRDVPFDSIHAEINKDQCNVDMEEMSKIIFDQCDGFNHLWSVIQLPYMNYHERHKRFGLIEHLKKDTIEALETVYQCVINGSDEEDLFDKFLSYMEKGVFDINTDLLKDRMKILQNLKISVPHPNSNDNNGVDCVPNQIELDKLLGMNLIWDSSMIINGQNVYDLIGNRIASKKHPNITGTTGWVMKRDDLLEWCGSSLTHVVLDGRHGWCKTNSLSHADLCQYTTAGRCTCELLCQVGKDKVYEFIAECEYEQGDDITSGHETALLLPLHDQATFQRSNINLDPLKTLYFKGSVNNNPTEGSPIYKLGQKTGLTKGYVNGLRQRFVDHGLGIELCYQIVVGWSDKEQHFSKPGDSGAPVFLEKDGIMTAVGWLEGGSDRSKESKVSPVKESYNLLPFKLNLYQSIPRPSGLLNIQKYDPSKCIIT